MLNFYASLTCNICSCIQQKAAQKLTKATRQLKQNVLVLSAGRIAKHMQKIAEIARYIVASVLAALTLL